MIGKRIRVAAALAPALLLLSAGGAQAQWSGDPTVNTAVCAAGGRQEPARMVADALGRTIWAWQDARNGVPDVYAQRLDARGNRLWGDQGTPVCVEAHAQTAPAVVGAGAGAIVVWEDARSDSGDIYAQSLDAAGAPRWTLDGLAACAEPGRQLAPRAVADDSGGVIVAWVDRRDAANTTVYAQRLVPDGRIRWAAGGVPVGPVPGVQDEPSVVADGSGGAFVVWADSRGGYRARRIDREGAVQWAADGVALCTQGTPLDLRAIDDGLGGLIVTWDRTDATGFFRDVYAQRVDGAGSTLWPDTGVVVSSAALLQRAPVLATDGAGGAIIAWEDGRVFHQEQVFAQRVDAGGNPLWVSDGVALRTTNTTPPFPAIAPDGAGGAIVAWQDDRGGSLDVYAQRVGPDGIAQWSAEGVPVSTAPDSQAAIVMAPDGAGGALIGWTDGRDPTTRTDVYAARLLAGGTLDDATVSVPEWDRGGGDTKLALASPNPLHGSAELEFTLARAGRAALAVFDVRGRLVRRLASGLYAAGAHRARWDLRDEAGRAVASGVYYIRLSGDGRRVGVRCVALR